MPTFGMPRRLQQANFIVMVERADRQPGALCQLAYFESFPVHGDFSRQ
jgi:hypothetical protein